MTILRLFQAYRRLEDDLSETAARAISAEDHSRYWKSRCELAEADRDKARDGETSALKAVVDWHAVQSGARPIFTPLPVVEPGDAAEYHRSPREALRELNRKAREEHLKKMRPEEQSVNGS